MNIGEAEISSGVAVGKFFVIQSHQMQDGGMEVVDVHRVGAYMDTVFIGFTKGHAGSHTSSSEPGGEDPVMVFSSASISGGIEWGASKFGGPDN